MFYCAPFSGRTLICTLEKKSLGRLLRRNETKFLKETSFTSFDRKGGLSGFLDNVEFLSGRYLLSFDVDGHQTRVSVYLPVDGGDDRQQCLVLG